MSYLIISFVKAYNSKFKTLLKLQIMGKLVAFNFVSLNGFSKGPKGDVSWAHGDEESDEYAIESNKAGNTLLFGRVTYEMMAGFWPTPYALLPLAMGEGTPILNGIKKKLNLKLISSRIFKSGKVLLCYQPVE